MRFLLGLMLLPAFACGQSLVMIGGGLDAANDIVYGKIMELAGGIGAKIGIFTIAADSPSSEATKFINRFAAYGANATWIPVTSSSGNANDPAIAAMVAEQAGLFFCGGTRIRVINALKPGGVDTLTMTAIRQLLRNGGVLSGSSAGMATQSSRVVILDGETYDTLAFQNYTLNMGGLQTFEGNFMTDAHCSEYGREGRLIRVLYETRNIPQFGTTKGISIDEDHALVVTNLYNRPIGKVIGLTGGVKIFDVSQMTSRPSSTVDFQGALMSLLTVDDTIDITTGEITIASWKNPLAGTEVYSNASSSNDIFSSLTIGQWRDTANRLIDNKNDQTVTSFSSQRQPAFEVVFDRKQATAYGNSLPNDRRKFVYSFLDVLVDIRGI